MSWQAPIAGLSIHSAELIDEVTNERQGLSH
jgi:hypothetical protein